MKTVDWTRDELVAYILLFAADSDFKEHNMERNVILSKVDIYTFQDIHDEFNADNDYQGIQKIVTSLRQHQYEKEDIDLLMEDIRTLFFSDGEFNIKERNMLKCLSRIFQSL